MVGEDAANGSVRRPNLFKFATSELSQDAFICWLVSWAKNDHKGTRLHDCGKDFVALLYNLKHKSDPITASDIEEVKELKQQHLKIDVYFQAIIKGKIVSFIVEDKTHTSFHSGQLQRYKNGVDNDGIHEDETICVYFKTGCVWPEERKEATEKYGYCVLDATGLYEFLQEFEDIENPIFQDYLDYVEETFYLQEKYGFDKLTKESMLENFEYDSVKLAYMNELLSRCPKSIQDCAEYPYHGKNMDGSTWVIFDFCLRKDEDFGDYGEHLYCRLDWRKGGYYLAVRQYAKFMKSDDNIRNKKLERFRKYKEAFNSTVKELDHPVPFEFDKPVSDWSGKYESEIAVVFFNDSDKSPQKVLDTIPEILKSFVAGIEECKESHHA